MIQSDTDILLIDEVLAVGDAAFQQKCATVFSEMRDGDRTVVLVTHDMALRRPLLPSRDAARAGRAADSSATPRRPGASTCGSTSATIGSRSASTDGAVLDLHARVIEAQLEDGAGKRIENIAEGEPIRINIVLEALVDMSETRASI